MTLIEKLENNQRLTLEDGVALYDLDLFTLGKYANQRRRTLHGNKVFFNVNRHINPTNICKDICKFCAFSANRKNPNPYTMSHEEILSILDNSVKNNHITEVHVVSAHNPDAGFEWYMEIFSKIKERFPSLHVKALTAAEINFLATEYNLSFDEVIDKMIEYGVDSMPGGGAEIFDEKVRENVCKGKVSSAEWLQIHELWHKRGHESNATMLFGHVEKREHRIDHMLRLRDLQDRTNGFNAFIPLVYQRDNNYLHVDDFLSSTEILKTFAISRLMLDNIKHIKAYWATSTINLALVAQEYGADDLDGTIEAEAIQSAAGANSAKGLGLQSILELIETSGFTAVERDSLYNELKIY
ncbi:aminofutalosine synthase MqnE [Sulfurospirillum halorespirans]|uniref:Aminodeoxyfutalosine synthase n=1 Tax=Sulfurospirillum halorespirans DSM 13726 TaxID=1193502 RepID=A0A1D7TLK1_9BACT|nr:aminofutalosine synthase MqnE [Sulfurospirillum halorespirans]AOO65873.1 radical SAM protein [Sulfurospirillum halorespirans DSM 13726]